MKVLIISDYFYPQNNIGALRPTKVANQLFLRGHEVDVFTKYLVPEDTVREKHLCSMLYGYETYKPAQQATGTERKHGFLYRQLRRMYYNYLSIKAAQKVAKILSQNKELAEKQYDVVWSSFGPLASLLCGLQYKKMHPQTKWICDFRDPVVVRYVHPLLRPYYRHLEKKACRMADVIVAVSNGYLERICRGQFREKAYMIPNGYDLSDKAQCNKANAGKALELTYVGLLYGGDRDLSPLFQAIRELSDEGMISLENIRVNYAGREFEVLQKQAQAHRLSDIICDKGILCREDCLQLQADADALLISTWNDQDEYGVFPGKMLEYMLMDKPIISLTCGTLPNGEITQVVREGKFGVAYEAACHEADFAELKSFLRTCYQKKTENGVIPFSPDQNVLDRYNYQNIITRVEALMNES